MINIAVLGYGIVGSGVVALINSKNKIINENINVKYILDLREITEYKDCHTYDYNDILNDDSVKVIVEVIGGIDPSYEFTKRALLAGKHVVTSNKELVAKMGPSLLEIAKEHNVNYLFEASVGGAMPVIRNIKETLVADNILEITSILNGTTNYVLTKMQTDNLDFDEAIKRAQKEGYAEQNADNDILGFDTVRKLSIMLSLIIKSYVNYDQIETTGIDNITKEDLKLASIANSKIKLIAYAKKINDKFYATVSPMLVSSDNLISNVNNSNNIVSFNCEFMRNTVLIGEGAGKMQTATAVVADIIDICKNIDKNIGYFYDAQHITLLQSDNTPKKYFIVLTKNNNFTCNNYKIIEDCSTDKVAIITDKIDHNELTQLKLNLEKTSKIDKILTCI